MQPRGSETTNGRTINTPTPTTYSNGSPNLLATDSATRLSRSWFTQNTGYTLSDVYGPINNDAQHALVTGSDGLTTELNWKIPSGQTLTSITAWKSYHFNAVNDDGTPFDIYRNSGGFWNDYHQVSQELRISSPTGGLVDYQAGLYFLKVNISATYQRAWGNDAGAWFASNAQYATLDATPAGQLLMQDSLANTSMAYNSPAGQQTIENKSAAAFAQANWHLTNDFTVTTGARLTHENRTNVSNTLGSASIRAVNGVALGGFLTNASGVLDPTNSADQVAIADATALEYFGVATYAGLTAAQQKQVAAAQAIRKANLGVLFGNTAARPYRANQPAFVLSPSYKLSPNVTTYLTYQHGEKAGIAQLVNGISHLVAPEKTNAFEWGVKSALLDKTLILNVDIFNMQISNYQQSVRVVDQYTTALNIARRRPTHDRLHVRDGQRAQGGSVRPRDRRCLRRHPAHDAALLRRLQQGHLQAVPELGAAGRERLRRRAALPRCQWHAARRRPEVHLQRRRRLPPAVRDRQGRARQRERGLQQQLLLRHPRCPQYAVVGQSALVDLAVGAGKHDKSFDVSVIVKNLFGNQTPQSRTWNSYTPANPRTFGIQFTGKL